MPSIVCSLMMSPGSSGHFPSSGRIANLVKLNGSQDQIQSHKSEKRTCGGEEGLIEIQREEEGVEEKVIRVHEDMHETVQIHLTKEKLS